MLPAVFFMTTILDNSIDENQYQPFSKDIVPLREGLACS